MRKQIFIFLALIGVLVACAPAVTSTPTSPAPRDDSGQTQTMPAAKTEALPPSSLTPSLTRTPTPISTNEPAIIELGEPLWIGRGKILDAVFLPGAQQAAIAWGSGVSLNIVETGEELWFQPTPTNLVAFDVQLQAQMFAAALTDGSVVTFDAATGASRRIEGARPNAYWGDIAWSPDGQTLAFQFIGPSRSDPIYLLDAASGQIREVPGSQTGEGVNPALIWSPDGSAITVRALGEDCPRFVDVQTGEERMRLGKPGQCSYIPPLLFLPNGQTMVVQGQAGGLDLLSFPDGARIRSFQSASDGIVGRLIEFPAAGGSLFMDPAGQWLASRGGYEPCYCGNPADQPYHPLIVWDLASGAAQAQLERAIAPLAERHRLAAAFEGDNILMLYESGEITRWAFGDPQASETVVAHVPVQPASAWTLRWSADGSHLAFSGRYGGVDIYQTNTGRLVRRFDPPLESPSLSPDGRLVALFDADKNEEAVYQVQSGQLLQTLPATPVLMGAAFSPDGLYLAYGDGARAVVAEVASGETTTLDPAPAAPVAADMAVSRLIWSPDGQALATVFGVASGDDVGPGMVVLWKRLEDGSFEAIYHVPNVQANYTRPNQVLAIFNHSGSRIALQSMDALEAGHIMLVVYDLESRKVLQTLAEYKPGAWLNDEELLAAEAQYDTRLTRIHVIRGDKTIGRMRDRGDCTYAPGGIYIAQMADPPGRGVTVKHWQSGKVLAQAKHEALNLVDYGWSPDGRWLASIGDDGTLIIWPVLVP